MNFLRNRFRLHTVFATEEWNGDGKLGAEVRRHTVDDDELRRLSFLQHPQQVVAVFEMNNEEEVKVDKDQYGSWDNVPNDVIVELINNNMLSSFVESVPSKFGSILNDANDPMGVDKADIDSVWLGCNGAVYLTNKVYSPTSFWVQAVPPRPSSLD